jgi:transketolase C-terminal domain/subunit
MTNEALRAADALLETKISAEVIKLSRVNPLPVDAVLSSLRRTHRLLISEDVCDFGCVGQRVLALCAKSGVSLSGAKLLNLGGGIAAQGSRPELLRQYALDADAMVSAAGELVSQG